MDGFPRRSVLELLATAGGATLLPKTAAAQKVAPDAGRADCTIRIAPGVVELAPDKIVSDNPGMTLFHCHMQLHMDYGFMCLFDYA